MQFTSILTPKAWLVTLVMIALFFVADLSLYLIYPFLFLVIGSLASRLNPSDQEPGGRNERQVLANGGVATLLIGCFLISRSEIFEVAIVVSFAAALSDTCSSEFGKRFGGATVDILSFRKIQRGLSGGISWMGTLGGVAGSFIMGALFWTFGDIEFMGCMHYCTLVIVLGVLGMLIDSAIGSAFQAKYLVEGKLTEKGQQSQLIKGYHIIDNDVVNLISIMITTFIGILIMKILMP